MSDPEEFAQRCMALHKLMDILRMKESSPGVWASVLSTKISELLHMTDNYEVSLKLFLSAMESYRQVGRETD